MLQCIIDYGNNIKGRIHTRSTAFVQDYPLYPVSNVNLEKQA